MAMSLAQLCARWPELQISGDTEIAISQVTVDSRQCGPETLFVAVVGSQTDGHDYVEPAIQAGCAAVMVQADRLVGLDLNLAEGRPAATIGVSKTLGWPARLSRELAGRPDASLVVVGVTGTNGKTTVTFLVQQLLTDLVGTCGMLGTIRYQVGDTLLHAPLTTPEGTVLFDLLSQMHQAGCRAVTLEISSHALDQQRVADLALDVAVMTNLSRDHLDYHADLTEYLQAKARIIELTRSTPGRGKPAGAVVLNAADPAFADLDTTGSSTVRFDPRENESPTDTTVRVRVVASKLTMKGTSLVLDCDGERYSLQSWLVGRFNVENLTAALAVGVALGLQPAACCAALAKVEQVPGRLQRFALPNGAVAVVDYAHTPEALSAVLSTCRELTTGRLSVVFGCGGDRDQGKRSLMGAVAGRLADQVWITSDNPRSEDPGAIIAAVETGFMEEPNRRAEVCETEIDRTQAIVAALSAAQPLDLVIIAGKGHEDYQLVGEVRLELDDSRTIREWIGREVDDG